MPPDGPSWVLEQGPSEYAEFAQFNTTNKTHHSSCCREQQSFRITFPSHRPKRSRRLQYPYTFTLGDDNLGQTIQMHPGEWKVGCCCTKLHRHKNISHLTSRRREQHVTNYQWPSNPRTTNKTYSELEE